MFIKAKKQLFIPLLALSLLVASALACDGGTNTPTPIFEPPTATPAPVQSELPDFAIVGYGRDPAEPLVVPSYTSVYYHIQVMNQGNASYNGAIVVRGPGNRIGGFDGLIPGETKEAIVEFLVGLPAGGTASDIYFTVDPDNIIEESNEENNSLGPLTVEYSG